MKKIAVYPGTFDPVTLGHMDVIRDSAAIFDVVVVGLLKNSQKRPVFDEDTRIKLIKEAVETEHLTRKVEVKCFAGAAVDFAEAEGAVAMVRGERLATESEQELALCFNNRVLNHRIIPVYFKSAQEHIHISSSSVREIITIGKFEALPKYVPPNVAELINARYNPRR